jgi:uncharacterized repeat protein (TIGR03943 family)
MTKRSILNNESVLNSILIGILTAAFLFLLMSGRYRVFIMAQLWPLLALGLFLLILFYFASLFRVERAPADPNASIRMIFRFAFFLMPVLYIAVSPADGLNSYLIDNQADDNKLKVLAQMQSALKLPSFSTGTASDIDPAADGGPNVSIADVFMHPEEYGGKTVTVEGRLHRQAGGDCSLFRYIIICCAAHAIPVSVPLNIGSAEACPSDEEYPQDCWVRIVGKVSSGQINAGSNSFIEVSKIDKIEPPRSPYISIGMF